MTGIGSYDWWEEEELEQDENRGQSKPKPKQETNEDGNANPQIMKEIDDFTQLILTELKSNREAVDSLRKDIDAKLESLRVDIQKVHSTEKELLEIKRWKESINETWSPRQMQEAKDEIYNQKNKWTMGYGIFISAQIIWAFILFFKDKLFK